MKYVHIRLPLIIPEKVTYEHQQFWRATHSLTSASVSKRLSDLMPTERSAATQWRNKVFVVNILFDIFPPDYASRQVGVRSSAVPI